MKTDERSHNCETGQSSSFKQMSMTIYVAHYRTVPLMRLQFSQTHETKSEYNRNHKVYKGKQQRNLHIKCTQIIQKV